ncbi:MAG: ubiquinone-binding protein [Micavibrio aeruginosavorus]|uniref:Ubiquinone-binding protein n=1 Tax=Micavibrio aeruginosavorus TaxID=349221 RepID=A0A2W5N3R2_9BACT|nr:MAG: ubiquinone-binding protein [Micavibrio aeruginosavorus]
MLKHIEQKKLPYTSEQMFDLVADVSRYQEFAPWCIASRINKRESGEIFYADLVVGYKMFRERFTSRVHLERPRRIHIEYLKGPLKNLRNNWVFSDAPDGGCIIDFSVEFEFGNVALQAIANMFFNEVVKRMVGAFEARAKDLYG